METINDIRKKFGIDEMNPVEIRKDLQKKLIELHPDKNNGEFENEEKKDQYNEILDSMEYLEQLNKDNQLVVVDKMTDLIKVVADLVPRVNKSSLDSNLSYNIDSAVSNYKSRLHIPKVSITALSGVLTFVLAFPQQISSNPILSRFIDPTSFVFGIIWFALLLYTAMFWLITIINEDRNKKNMESFKLNSTQNSIFETFRHSLKNNFFTKDELTLFILQKYSRGSINGLLLFSDQKITPSVAQNLAEVIIDRAQSKLIIEPYDTASLSEGYKINIKNQA